MNAHAATPTDSICGSNGRYLGEVMCDLLGENFREGRTDQGRKALDSPALLLRGEVD
jgi:hypothetical protein